MTAVATTLPGPWASVFGAAVEFEAAQARLARMGGKTSIKFERLRLAGYPVPYKRNARRYGR